MGEIREAGFYIKKIHDHMRREANEDLKGLDLTFSQMEVLFFLLERGDSETVHRDIEQTFRLTHPTVIGILKRLEKKQFIEVNVNLQDKRRRNIQLTQKSYAVAEHMAARKDAGEQRLIECIPDDKRDEFLDILEYTYKNFCGE